MTKETKSVAITVQSRPSPQFLFFLQEESKVYIRSCKVLVPNGSATLHAIWPWVDVGYSPFPRSDTGTPSSKLPSPDSRTRSTVPHNECVCFFTILTKTAITFPSIINRLNFVTMDTQCVYWAVRNEYLNII